MDDNKPQQGQLPDPDVMFQALEKILTDGAKRFARQQAEQLRIEN